MSMHRREKQGETVERVFRVIRQVVGNYLIHLNRIVQEVAVCKLGGHDRIHLSEPLYVIDFYNIVSISFIILIVSGGVQ